MRYIEETRAYERYALVSFLIISCILQEGKLLYYLCLALDKLEC